MTPTTDKKSLINLLIPKFWIGGYNISARKFGKYLPEPPFIGSYEIDVLAKRGKEYAIGICISSDDFRDTALTDKIAYLASRRSKFTDKKVPLFIGVPQELYTRLIQLLHGIDDATRRNIQVYQLSEEPEQDLFSIRAQEKRSSANMFI